MLYSHRTFWCFKTQDDEAYQILTAFKDSPLQKKIFFPSNFHRLVTAPDHITAAASPHIPTTPIHDVIKVLFVDREKISCWLFVPLLRDDEANGKTYCIFDLIRTRILLECRGRRRHCCHTVCIASILFLSLWISTQYCSSGLLFKGQHTPTRFAPIF